MTRAPTSTGAVSGRPAPGPTELPTPTLTRRAGGRVVGGVAGGLADHLDVDVFKVRVAFAALAAAAGAGIAAYGLLWIFTSAGSDIERPTAAERRRAYGLVAIGVGFAVALGWLLSGTSSSVIGPVVVVAIGSALVWREFDTDGTRSVGPSHRTTVLGWARIVAGVTLVVIGLGVVVLARVDLMALRSSLLAVVVTLVGAGLLTVPLWMRLWRALGTERAARIRNEEREEIASHLHDSVLQTLALIQKQSDDPAQVARLARSQERELRKWLFGDSGADHESLTGALATIAGEVEDHYAVTVDPVTVGDVSIGRPDDSGLSKEVVTALLGATRESLVNAAKHSGVAAIDLYAEVESERVSVFVRDRGIGFDVDSVPSDRQGLAKSVRGRIERRGGQVEVRSTPGRGTEVRIFVPRGQHESSTPETLSATDESASGSDVVAEPGAAMRPDSGVEPDIEMEGHRR